MQLFNALQIKAGAKIEGNRMGLLTRPLQFLSEKNKDSEWSRENIDWLEEEGIKQIRRNARKLLKNYKLAEGVIDKSDYIVEENNEHADLMDILTRDSESPMELKFFPIVPNIINILTNEFAKRNSRIQYRAVDEISVNEMLSEKYAQVEQRLMQDASMKQQQRMMELGFPPESEEGQQMMSPETLKSLPEIEQFFKKDYQSIYENWANYQHKVDVERFSMTELEITAFKDMLTTDREFWHFRMMENDYEVELWNPVTTFYHKSPNKRYISQGNYVGKIDLMTSSDVVDTYGYLMTEKQLDSLESYFPAHSNIYAIPGIQNDGGFYNAQKSHAWNTNLPSLAMRQYVSQNERKFTGDIIEQIYQQGEDLFNDSDHNMFRVTTTYWMSQRWIAHLTKKLPDGQVIQDIVTESYKITTPAVYNNIAYHKKSKETLLLGEHLDWFAINDAWGGVKIGLNKTTHFGENDANLDPIYLGIDNFNPARLKFQFKGDDSLVGSKLPVEGRIFSDRNSKSNALVDKTKGLQVQYNMVNNMIGDILVDDLGTVIALDQNALPKHSMGEDWGKSNLAKAYVAMKDFKILPFDTTIANTENALNFQHYQVLNMEQTNRLLGLVSLANHFKEQCFELVGITGQRRGEQLDRQTAKGVEEGLEASYAQTEGYFIQHSDQLMPRVHQMRTDLAQYYHSQNPSVRLQVMTSLDERINFEMNTTTLLCRDINVFGTTNVNSRKLLKDLQQLALNNNNATGSTIHDLAKIRRSESIAELDRVTKSIEERLTAERQKEMDHEKELEDMRIQAEEKARVLTEQTLISENQLDREARILEAEIKASGYGATEDINANGMSDFNDSMKELRARDEFQSKMNHDREKEVNKNSNEREKRNLAREKMQSDERIADKEVQVSRINKNQYDKPTPKKKK